MDESKAILAFAALAQPTRLAVFRLLVQAGHVGCPAGEIADALSVLPNTLSTHLGLLVQASLVHKEREGRSIRYRARFEGVQTLLTFLMHDCCGGDRAQCDALVARIACPC